MQDAKMHAKYLRRISCTIVIFLAGALVFHAAVKYRRFPFGIGGNYRLVRSSYVEQELPEEFAGGLYGDDYGDRGGGGGQRSRAQFCLDGSPLPPSLSTPQPTHRSMSSASFYHILNYDNGNLSLSSNSASSTNNLLLDKVAAAIKEKYNDLLQATLNNRAIDRKQPTPCRPRIIEYRCAGFGDRLRGMSATFLIALLTNSVFSLNWDYPVSLEAFFEPPFLPRKTLIEQFFPEKPVEIVIRAIDEEEDIVWLLSDISRMHYVLKTYDVIVFEINSLVPFEVLLSHPYYRSLVDFYDITNFSYSELFSIALRILLPQYSRRLAESLVPFTSVLQSPQYDARVGIQIRLGSSEWNEFTRVEKSQVRCFVSELANITAENRYRNVLVFVTADSSDALNEVRQLTDETFNLNKSTKVKVISADDVAAITHIDRTSFSTSDHQAAVTQGLRTFVDWAVLASPQMNHLIISRSSFGETAGMMRMAKSIRRLAHNITDSCSFNDYIMTSVWMEASAAVPTSTPRSAVGLITSLLANFIFTIRNQFFLRY